MTKGTQTMEMKQNQTPFLWNIFKSNAISLLIKRY